MAALSLVSESQMIKKDRLSLCERTEFDGTFNVENVPNLSICSDQRIGIGSSALESSLPGGLVAIYENEKVLLLPKSQ